MSHRSGQVHHRHRQRTRQQVFFDLTDTTDERFDPIIEGILIVLLAFSPVALGAVQAWSETVVIALSAAMVLLLAIKLLARRDVRFVWSWTYLPVGGFIALTLFQLVPLPVGLLEIISPSTLELRRSIASQANFGPALSVPARVPLSFYPEATAGQLRMLLAVAAAYVVTLNVIRRGEQVRRMLGAMTLIGVGVGAIAAIHLILRAPRIYWLIGEDPSSWTIAPFINRNHFGQFINLSLGAAIGLFVLHVRQALGRRTHSLANLRGVADQTAATDDVDPIASSIDPLVWWLGGAIAFMATMVVLSLSRGAWLSMALAGMLAALVAGGRRGLRMRLWLLVPLAWVVLVAVVGFGFDALAARVLESRDVGSHSVAGRIAMVRDLLEGARQFALLGVGLGVFEVFFPMLDRSNWPSLATHAENEFAQTLLETGVLGLGLVLLFLAMIGWAWCRCVRSRPSPMARLAVGLGFSLAAILLQSVVDFGQHIPANANMTAVTCALLVTLATASAQTHASGESSPQPAQTGASGRSAGHRARAARHRLWRAAGTLAAALLATGLLWDSISRTRAEFHWSRARRAEARLIGLNWAGSDEDYRRLLASAMQASALRPADVHYRYWLNYFRWKYIEQSIDPAAGRLTDPLRQQWATRVVEELLAATRLAPCYGPAYSLAGQIALHALGQADASGLVLAGYRLGRTDPVANLEAGLLEAQQGRWESAMQRLHHAAELHEPYLFEAIDALAQRFDRADLALKLAGENVAAIRRLAQRLEQAGDPRAADAHARLSQVVEQQAAAPDASMGVLMEAARLAAARADHPAAEQYCRRALLLNFADPLCRLELARALAAQGRISEALAEARLAERLGAPGASDLILKLRLSPGSAATSQSQPRGEQASSPDASNRPHTIGAAATTSTTPR
ncbi:O-antigen ligase family protein [Fontivita pretiosa]|uniref:O-antigen ligase family protein n=1 Tax=Fontivita pretiosa TaxID=2989684 RepID=UPI003D170DE9